MQWTKALWISNCDDCCWRGRSFCHLPERILMKTVKGPRSTRKRLLRSVRKEASLLIRAVCAVPWGRMKDWCSRFAQKMLLGGLLWIGGTVLNRDNHVMSFLLDLSVPL